MEEPKHNEGVHDVDDDQGRLLQVHKKSMMLAILATSSCHVHNSQGSREVNTQQRHAPAHKIAHLLGLVQRLIKLEGC